MSPLVELGSRARRKIMAGLVTDAVLAIDLYHVIAITTQNESSNVPHVNNRLVTQCRGSSKYDKSLYFLIFRTDKNLLEQWVIEILKEYNHIVSRSRAVNKYNYENNTKKLIMINSA